MVSGKKEGSKRKRTPKKFTAPTSSQTTPPQTTKTNNENTSNSSPVPRIDLPQASDILALVRAEENQQKLKVLQCTSINEFHKLVHGDADLWKLDQVSGNYVLNEFEYKRQLEPCDAHILQDCPTSLKEDKPLDQLPDFSNIPVFDDAPSDEAAVPDQSLTTECSKETVVVFMDPLDLVDLFMDVKQWSDCFYDNVSNAEVLETILKGEDGADNYSGALQLVSAEFHFPSPLVETRKSYFLRSCYEMPDCESWVVVDVSLDSIFPNLSKRYIKRPSGCLIEAENEDGYSRVTWIEHVEVDSSMVHDLFKPLVTSGYGFGAARWAATLIRQIDRFSSYYGQVVMEVTEEGRKSLLSLTERMNKKFILGISASSENTWKPIPIPGSEDILVRTKYNTDNVGCPRGVIVTVATTKWLLAQPCKVLDFLRETSNRHKWDLLSLNRPTQAIASGTTDSDPRGCVSIIPVLPSMPVMFNLQEVSVGTPGTHIVYAPVDMYALHSVLQGGDSSDVQILSSGFVVMPDRPPVYGEDIGGTLLTISFQIVDNEYETVADQLPQKSVATFHRIMTETAALIKAAVVE